MTRVKICGITNLEDALHAVHCGADALGFIFVPDTPRYVHAYEGALQIPSQIPPFVTRVAVFQDLGLVDRRWVGRYDAIQFYEDSVGSDALAGKRLIRVVRFRDESSLAEVEAAESTADAVLLDAFHPEKLGGAGVRMEWSLAAEARSRVKKPVILAGGLNPDNVQEAVEVVRPYAVDVSSGVESEPGRKDPEKVRRFIEAVREFDRRNPL